MPEVRHFTCNLCDALCGLNVTVEGNRVLEVRGDPDDPFSRGHICPKGPALKELHEDPDRLRTPMRRTASGWEPVGWEEALAEAAGRLRAIQKRHGRHAVGLYAGNPSAHGHRAALGVEALTLALRSHNRFDANSQDSNPRLFACMQVYGDGLSIPVPDIDRIEHLVILGANPAVSNGSQMSLGDVRRRLAGIRARGGRVVLIDPRRTESAALADEHHFLKPNGDAALLLAMLHVIFADGVDAAAIDARASGREELAKLAARFAPEHVAPAIGMAADTISRIARELAAARRGAIYGRIGTCQNEFGPTANWLVEAINVVTGHLDREGCMMFPQPAADIGPLARLLIGNQYARWRSRVRGLPELYGVLPSAVMAEEMETPGDGQLRGFVTFAGNPVLSTPNGPRLARALERLECFVAVDFYLNETTRHAHLVLPPVHAFETSSYNLLFFGLAVRNLARFDPPILEAPEGARDDWQIMSELALRIGLPSWLPAWRLQGKALPDRLIDLLLRTGRNRLSLAKLAEHPHGLDLGPLEPAWRDKIRTPDGRARLAPEVLAADVARVDRWIEAQSGAQPSLVLIGRRHLRSNNSWMHNLPSLVKGPGRARLQINPADAAARGLTDGTRVRVQSRTGSIEAELELTDTLMPGVVSLPHGFGHAATPTLRVAATLSGPNLNALTDEHSVEPLAGTSILNGLPITISEAGDRTRGSNGS
jgi:anaerobic selenocysteine-containing dehydrogenase